jgi:hypothetical protein
LKSSAKKIELASVDDLFSTEEGRQDAKLEKIQEIPLSELHPFKNHPFKVKDDEAISNRENAAAHKPIQRKERNDYVYGKGNSRSNPGRLQSANFPYFSVRLTTSICRKIQYFWSCAWSSKVVRFAS